MKRRQFISLLGGAASAWPQVAWGQQQAMPFRVGVLMTQSPESGLVYLAAVKTRLRELGHVEGKTITIDHVWAEGRIDRFLELAAELVKRKPDVVVAPTTAATMAVRQIAPDMPTVFVTAADPVGMGLIASYARPGGSATGMQTNADTLPGKQIELLRELVPAATRIGMLVNDPNPSTIVQHRNAATAAASVGVTLLPVSISRPDDIEAAFDHFVREGAQALIFPTDATVSSNRKRIANLAIKARLPSIFPYRDEMRAGGLINYGVDLVENYRRAADFVDKILHGAKPGDLPVEFPTRLYLGVNLRTAKAIGLTISESFLVRADEVIE